MTGHTNPDEVDPDSVTTMDQVKAIHERLGFPAEAVGYLGDPHTRHDGGVSLVSRTDNGLWQIAGYDRGKVWNPRVFDTEIEALRSLARSAVKMANNPKADLSQEELAELNATAGERRRRMEERTDRAIEAYLAQQQQEEDGADGRG